MKGLDSILANVEIIEFLRQKNHRHVWYFGMDLHFFPETLILDRLQKRAQDIYNLHDVKSIFEFYLARPLEEIADLKDTSKRVISVSKWGQIMEENSHFFRTGTRWTLANASFYSDALDQKIDDFSLQDALQNLHNSEFEARREVWPEGHSGFIKYYGAAGEEWTTASKELRRSIHQKGRVWLSAGDPRGQESPKKNPIERRARPLTEKVIANGGEEKSTDSHKIQTTGLFGSEYLTHFNYSSKRLDRFGQPLFSADEIGKFRLEGVGVFSKEGEVSDEEMILYALLTKKPSSSILRFLDTAMEPNSSYHNLFVKIGTKMKMEFPVLPQEEASLDQLVRFDYVLRIIGEDGKPKLSYNQLLEQISLGRRVNSRKIFGSRLGFTLNELEILLESDYFKQKRNQIQVGTQDGIGLIQVTEDKPSKTAEKKSGYQRADNSNPLSSKNTDTSNRDKKKNHSRHFSQKTVQQQNPQSFKANYPLAKGMVEIEYIPLQSSCEIPESLVISMTGMGFNAWKSLKPYLNERFLKKGNNQVMVCLDHLAPYLKKAKDPYATPLERAYERIVLSSR